MMTDSKSDEPEDLIEPLPGKQIINNLLEKRNSYFVIH